MTYPAQLRALAAFLEQHPELEPTANVTDTGTSFHLNGREDWRQLAATVVETFGPVGRTQTHGDWLVLERPASPIGEVILFVPRYDEVDVPEVDLEGIVLAELSTAEEVDA